MADKSVKGCPNEECPAYKKIKYKADDHFCLKCGEELIYVCDKCWTPLSGNDKKIKTCAKCQAKAKDRMAHLKENAVNAAKVAGTAAVAAAGVVAKSPDMLGKASKAVGKVLGAVVKK